jgi:hypothetical protein
VKRPPLLPVLRSASGDRDAWTLPPHRSVSLAVPMPWYRKRQSGEFPALHSSFPFSFPFPFPFSFTPQPLLILHTLRSLPSSPTTLPYTLVCPPHPASTRLLMHRSSPSPDLCYLTTSLAIPSPASDIRTDSARILDHDRRE